MRIRVDAATGCWIWLGDRNSTGYGRVSVNGKREFAHRASYRLFVGPTLEGMQLDHLCRTPLCVNPAHLEEVTASENVRRGVSPAAWNAHKTHCKRGHEFDARNTYIPKNGYRQCRRCRADRERSRQRRLREAGIA